MEGPGTVLFQKGRIIIYAPKTLTPGDIRYSNIRRELLITMYLADTNREEVIAAVSPQLQCLLLRLAKYDVELTYLKD